MEVAGRRKRRNLHLGLRLAVWLGFNLLVFGVSVLFTDSRPDSQQLQSDELSRYSRDVTSSQKTQNCTRKVSRNAINQYPKDVFTEEQRAQGADVFTEEQRANGADLFTEEQRAKGAVILHVFFVLYLFLLTCLQKNSALKDLFTEEQRAKGADLFTEEQRAKGAVILHVFFGLYLFLATAIVCEDYFMPAIYVCTERFQLDPGIVGAVIVGSFCSSPELATTTIGVFISENDVGVGAMECLSVKTTSVLVQCENDVGVGAMVGTAVTNYVLIIGLCCLMKPAGKDVMVQPWTVTRDTVWGGIAMVVFIIVVMDGKADW
ncbi:hypothetical protein Bbelb_228870 [Branchiostoma belcheri]|nr:hypothetical protein Bbelb_228870 [Branchiostoma belcheri]